MTDWKERTGVNTGKSAELIEAENRSLQLVWDKYWQAEQAITEKARQDRMRATYTRFDENGDVIDE